MAPQFSTSGGPAAITLLAGLTSLVSLLTTLFWIVVGWRAMRAHEEIATLLRERHEPPS